MSTGGSPPAPHRTVRALLTDWGFWGVVIATLSLCVAGSVAVISWRGVNDQASINDEQRQNTLAEFDQRIRTQLRAMKPKDAVEEAAYLAEHEKRKTYQAALQNMLSDFKNIQLKLIAVENAKAAEQANRQAQQDEASKANQEEAKRLAEVRRQADQALQAAVDSAEAKRAQRTQDRIDASPRAR